MSSVEEDDYDTLADIDSDKNVIRTKVCPHVGWPWSRAPNEGRLCVQPQCISPLGGML